MARIMDLMILEDLLFMVHTFLLGQGQRLNSRGFLVFV